MSGREFPEPDGNYQSFIVRVYLDDRREFHHGQITHVSSRSYRNFQDLDETPTFIRGLLDDAVDTPPALDAPRPLLRPSDGSSLSESTPAVAPPPAAAGAMSPARSQAGIPLEALPPWDTSRHLERALKRGLDVAAAVVALALLALPMALIAIAIKLDSRGPVIYKQQRAGERGQIFTMYKFRSMRFDADDLLPALSQQNEQSLPLFKIRNDPRKTRVGRVLRRLSLDELPQLCNVLTGDLSLVGPRPPMATELAAYEPAHWQRLAVPQGITGLWQVSGRSLLTFDEMLLLDIHYIRSWSFMSDVLILLRTIPTVLTGRGAF